MKRTRKRYGVAIAPDEKRVLNEVQNHFKVSADDAYWLMIDLGEDYLKTRCAWSAMGKAQLRKSQAFWAWFEMKWIQLDLQLEATAHHYNRSADVYENLHRRCFRTPLPNYFWKELNKKASVSRTKRQTAKVIG